MLRAKAYAWEALKAPSPLVDSILPCVIRMQQRRRKLLFQSTAACGVVAFIRSTQPGMRRGVLLLQANVLEQTVGRSAERMLESILANRNTRTRQLGRMCTTITEMSKQWGKMINKACSWFSPWGTVWKMQKKCFLGSNSRFSDFLHNNLIFNSDLLHKWNW